MSEVTVTTNRRLPSGCAIPFGLLFAAAGIALAWFFGWSTFRETWRVRTWPETACTVTRAEVKVSVNGGEPRVQPDISYRYTWQGAERSGTKLRAGVVRAGDSEATPIDSDVNAMEATCAALRAAPEQRCRVNPLDPADSVLEKPGYGAALAFLAGGGVMVVIGFLVTLSALGLGRLFGWLLTPVFSLLFGAAGVAIYWFGIRGEPDWSAVQARMQTVPCTIVSSRVEESTSSGKNKKRTYKADVCFRYEFGGRTWHSRWPDFNRRSTSSSNAGAARDFVARHPVGQQRTCHVDPEQPWMAVLEKRGGGRFWLWMLAILFGVIGFAVFLRWLLRIGLLGLGLAAAARRA